jgi:hypothetical protein
MRLLIGCFVVSCVYVAMSLPPQRADFLDNCDWCVKQSRVTQPLNLDDWYANCKQVAKPVWFNHRTLGRCYGTGKQLTENNWLYTKRHGWLYVSPQHDHYYYVYKHGWVYIKAGTIYDFVSKRWLHN